MNAQTHDFHQVTAHPEATENEETTKDSSCHYHSFPVVDDSNYPVFVVGDWLCIDDRVNRFDDEGSYLWEGEIWEVQLKPHGGGLYAYQISGKSRDIAFEDFNPSGEVISSYRPRKKASEKCEHNTVIFQQN